MLRFIYELTYVTRVVLHHRTVAVSIIFVQYCNNMVVSDAIIMVFEDLG